MRHDEFCPFSFKLKAERVGVCVCVSLRGIWFLILARLHFFLAAIKWNNRWNIWFKWNNQFRRGIDMQCLVDRFSQNIFWIFEEIGFIDVVENSTIWIIDGFGIVIWCSRSTSGEYFLERILQCINSNWIRNSSLSTNK